MTKSFPSTSAIALPNLGVGMSAFLIHSPSAAKLTAAVYSMLATSKPAKRDVRLSLSKRFIVVNLSLCCVFIGSLRESIH
jgi:hypothetical protein